MTILQGFTNAKIPNSADLIAVTRLFIRTPHAWETAFVIPIGILFPALMGETVARRAVRVQVDLRRNVRARTVALHFVVRIRHMLNDTRAIRAFLAQLERSPISARVLLCLISLETESVIRSIILLHVLMEEVSYGNLFGWCCS